MVNASKQISDNRTELNSNNRLSIHPKNKKSRVRIILGCFLIIGLAISIGVIFDQRTIERHAATNQYCESIDPTGCTIKTKIRNDTSSTYIIKQCKDDNIPCKSFAQVSTLQAGKSYNANGSTNGIPQPWIVLDLQGKIAGCLNLEFIKTQESPAIVPLSKMFSCDEVNNRVQGFNKNYKAF